MRIADANIAIHNANQSWSGERMPILDPFFCEGLGRDEFAAELVSEVMV